MRAHHRQGFPCCRVFHLPCMLAPLPRRARLCMCRFSSQTAIGLPLTQGGSAPALPVFEACSAFAHAPACMVAELLNAALLSGVLQSMSLPPRTARPLPAGRTVAGWDSHPPGKRAFPRRTWVGRLAVRRADVLSARPVHRLEGFAAVRAVAPCGEQYAPAVASRIGRNPEFGLPVLSAGCSAA